MSTPASVSSHVPQTAGLNTQRVLATDADVLFAGDWAFPPSHPLPTFAGGNEILSGRDVRLALNSGVLYLNVSSMVHEWPGLLEYAVARNFKFLVAVRVARDQARSRKASLLTVCV